MAKDKKTIEVIYEEISSSWQFQRDAINVLHNKSNWVAAIDTLFITGLLAEYKYNTYAVILSLLPFIASLLFALWNFWPLSFSRGPNNEEIFQKKSDDCQKLVEELTKYKINTIKKNDQISILLNDNLKISTVCSIFGIVIMLICYLFQI